jgi:hypothetical protein
MPFVAACTLDAAIALNGLGVSKHYGSNECSK